MSFACWWCHLASLGWGPTGFLWFVQIWGGNPRVGGVTLGFKEKTRSPEASLAFLTYKFEEFSELL